MKKIILIVVVIAVIAVAVVFVLPLITKQTTAPQSIPLPTQETILPETGFTLSSSKSDVKVGESFNVSLLVRSDQDFANLFVAKLHFPANLLEVTNIDLKPKNSNFVANWFLTNWVENVYDNNSGSISLVGGVPNPGFKTTVEASSSAMADITFTAKKGGAGAVTFDNTSAIYRNLDNSNILAIKREVFVKVAETTLNTTPTITNIKGDLNLDGKVDLVDLSALLSRFGQDVNTGDSADLNADKKINSFDYSIMVKILSTDNIVNEQGISNASSSALLEL